eukprot:m.42228 g.42228  ORF g.42228 m.42228 type:complete len:300 (+) comp6080_c0_seq2:1539-2438(+)
MRGEQAALGLRSLPPWCSRWAGTQSAACWRPWPTPSFPCGTTQVPFSSTAQCFPSHSTTKTPPSLASARSSLPFGATSAMCAAPMVLFSLPPSRPTQRSSTSTRWPASGATPFALHALSRMTRFGLRWPPWRLLHASLTLPKWRMPPLMRWTRSSTSNTSSRSPLSRAAMPRWRCSASSPKRPSQSCCRQASSSAPLSSTAISTTGKRPWTLQSARRRTSTPSLRCDSATLRASTRRKPTPSLSSMVSQWRSTGRASRPRLLPRKRLSAAAPVPAPTHERSMLRRFGTLSFCRFSRCPK